MPTEDQLQQRIEALEIKASYADDLLEDLNLTIYKQQQQIDHLSLKLHELRQQQSSDNGGAGARSLRDELPPHY